MRKIINFFVAFVSIMPVCAETFPYQNPDLSPAERASDLCSRLTLEEKALLMRNSSPAIPRLGIPAYDWWSEALHGIGRNGTATVFPSCIGMAASFDDNLIEEIFTAVSDEGRAKNNIARHSNSVGKYKGTSFWTPNINIFRDPRWGRGQETYGEDPYMNGRMGSRVVRGLQGDPDSKYFKLLACAKHYAVHSGPEKIRHTFNITDLPERDLWETYLPAFKTLVQDAGVREVMCAYQRYEGKPCCGSDELLHHILRDKWGFDGLVVSDCGAIGDFYREGRHEVSRDADEATALGVSSGTDVECGNVYAHIPEAVRKGLLSEKDVDNSVLRLLEARFSVGDFDPDEVVSWTSIPESVIASSEHRALARKMGQEQTVLLKNNGILPLSKENNGRLMVMGPNACDSTMLWGIYYGQPRYSVTMLRGVENKIGDVPYTAGCGITRMQDNVSIIDRLTHGDGVKGLKAEYWNNTQMAGNPVTTAVYTSPILLDNGGNTAFAPGVNLTDFTTRIKGSFVAEEDESLKLIFNNDDGLRIIVNGDTIHNRWREDRLNYRTKELKVKKGKKYDIQLDYMQLADGATLNFDIQKQRNVTAADAVEAAKDADTIIFFGGISPAYEREEASVNEPGFFGGDRTSIELPKCQRDILAALHKAGKRIVLVCCSGSAVALEPEDAICDAILEAWYPGEEGGNAVADIIFGDAVPSGKLPVTFYRSDAQLPDFEDYHMEGRTYRFMHSKPLYPFGHGLSYTSFHYSKPSFRKGVLTVDITNTGKVDGTEIVQLYVSRPDDKSGPVRTLRAYERVDIPAGETRRVKMPLNDRTFEWWDSKMMEMRPLKGEYIVEVGPSSDPSSLKAIKVKR